MKKELHVFLLFTLIAFFAAVANAGQVSLQTGDDGQFVNMPVTGTETLVIPSGVTSFKVYDDGLNEDEPGNYSNNADGYLVLKAPTGYIIQVEGIVNTEDGYDHLSLYDGEDANGATLDYATGEEYHIGTLVSTGSFLTLYFHSDESSTHSGFELNVSLVSAPTPHAVLVNDVEGGSASSDKLTAVVGETVTLTLTPNENKVATGIYVVNENGNPIKVSGWDWLSGGKTATFVMPAKNVEVSAVFAESITAGNGVFINMPISGTEDVTIPAGVSSFKVYDDGGENGDYGDNANGNLVLHVPSGFLLQVTGMINTESGCDYLSIYDVKDDGETLLERIDGEYLDVGTIVSTGNIIKINFESDESSTRTGLDLTISLVDVSTPHTVTLNADGGTVSSDKLTAKFGETVTLTLTPSGNNHIVGTTVTAEDGKPVKVTGGNWYSGSNTATFVMPTKNVTVNAIFAESVTAEGGASINMPISGTESITIPAGVSSFKVYDDGGQNGDYSNDADGYLVLTAPNGYTLQLTGSLSTEYSDRLTVYEDLSSMNEITELRGDISNLEPVYSTGNSMVLRFSSDNYDAYSGLELVVSVVVLTPHAVVIADAEGGSVYSSTDLSVPNRTITLSATPNEGYVLYGIEVTTDDNEPVAVFDGKWYSDNTATFVMPEKNVTVTPVFVRPENVAGGLSIDMPIREYKVVVIPEGVTSFKVYDDGGASEYGSAGEDGYLEMRTPSGTYLQVTGRMSKNTKEPSTSSTLTIYDGDSYAGDLFNHNASGMYDIDIGTVTSSGDVMTIYYGTSIYQEGQISNADLELDVTVAVNASYTVTLVDDNGGTASVDKTEAYAGETISVEVVPANNSLLEKIEVVDASNHVIAVEDGNWYSSNTGTFVMPRSNVSVHPKYVSELTAEGGLYINMPTGDSWITIPEGVSSFKLYDNGGKDGDCTQGAYGTLVLTAPEGKVFRVSSSGTLADDKDDADWLGVNDGEWGNTLLYKEGPTEWTDIGAVLSTENVISIAFSSHSYKNPANFELVVSIIDPPAPYTITYTTSDNGSVSGDASARYWETVTLTASANSGYLLSGIEVKGEESHSLVDVTGGNWYSGNTATFVMPAENVEVTPVFTDKLTAEDGLSITMRPETRTIDLPEGLQSFKLYSDEAFEYGDDGSLYLNAPKGHVFVIEGLKQYTDHNPLTIEDDSEYSGYQCIWGYYCGSSSESVSSRTNRIKLRYETYYGEPEGLDLTVRLMDIVTPHSITVADNVTGGSMVSDVDEASLNTRIHLTASPDANYLLDTVIVVDALGNTVSVDGGKWYSENLGAFEMPASDVTVTPVFTNDFSNFYINMPYSGNVDVHIPEGVTSFRVYDDGGATGNSLMSWGNSSRLDLTAPDGFILQVTGSMTVESYNVCLKFYEAGNTLKEVCGSGDVGTILSNGKELSIEYVSNDKGGDPGFELTVTLVEPTSSHTISIADADGGIVESDKETAYLGDVVTLTATPATGYMLKEIVVKDANDVASTVVGGTWASHNSATFAMPYSNVTVYPSFTDNFTADGGLYVNMPVTGADVIEIPEGVESFRVYDDGGTELSATGGANGYLELRAPVGYLLRVSGYTSGMMMVSGNFKLYNGDSTKTILYEQNVAPMMPGGGSWGTVPVTSSTGNIMAIRFSTSATAERYIDLSLLVSVVRAEDHTIALGDYDGGVIALDKSSAKVGETITLTIDPDPGYVLSGLRIEGATSLTTTELGEFWFKGETATFEMPDEDITVTPLFTNQLTAEGGLYINMPVSGIKQVTVPSGVTSFKIYDDGGMYGSFSKNADGYIQLTAPEGRVFVIEGSKNTSFYETLGLLNGLEEPYASNEFSLYSPDADVILVNQYQMGSSEIGPIASAGNTMTVNFRTSSNTMMYPMTTYDGLDLTITISEPLVAHNITVANVDGGTVSVQTTANLGEKVYVEPEPAEGFLFDGISIEDMAGNPVAVTEVHWYTNVTPSFKMPLSDVLVTPVFTDELSAEQGLHIDLSTSENFDVDVPSVVSSFKIYDDGGADGDYSPDNWETITLNAPSGYELVLTGTMTASGKSYLSVEIPGGDCSSGCDIGSDGEGAVTDIGEFTAGQMTISFVAREGYDDYSGLDLTVRVVEKTHYAAITIRKENGKTIADIDGMYNGNGTTYIDREIYVNKVIFNRDFLMGGYSTIVLPFNVNAASVDGWRQVLEFDGIGVNDENRKYVKMKRAWCDAEKLSVGVSADSAAKLRSICGALLGKLSANTPYMIDVDDETLVFNDAATLLPTTEPEVRVGDWVFRGTLSKTEWKKGNKDIGKVYGFAAGSGDGVAVGDFVKFTAGAWIRPLRAYIMNDPVDDSEGKSLARRYARSNGTVASVPEELPDRMEIVIVDPDVGDGEEHTTVIGHINTRTGEVTMERNYDLKGRKLNGKPSARGMYYGKKKLVK